MLKNFRNKLLTAAAGGDAAPNAADGAASPSAGAAASVSTEDDSPVSGFICPQCRQDFPDPEALQMHFLAHLEEAADSEKKAEAAAAAAASAAATTPSSDSKRGSIFKARGAKASSQQPAASSTFYPGEEAEEFVCPMCEQRFALPDQLQVRS